MPKAKKMVLKKIDAWSLAKIYAISMGIVGLILGIIIAAFGTALGSVYAGGYSSVFVATGPLLIIVLPVIYAIAGLISGAFIALLYNVIAVRVGGIKLVLEQSRR